MNNPMINYSKLHQNPIIAKYLAMDNLEKLNINLINAFGGAISHLQSQDNAHAQNSLGPAFDNNEISNILDFFVISEDTNKVKQLLDNNPDNVFSRHLVESDFLTFRLAAKNNQVKICRLIYDHSLQASQELPVLQTLKNLFEQENFIKNLLANGFNKEMFDLYEEISPDFLTTCLSEEYVEDFIAGLATSGNVPLLEHLMTTNAEVKTALDKLVNESNQSQNWVGLIVTNASSASINVFYDHYKNKIDEFIKNSVFEDQEMFECIEPGYQPQTTCHGRTIFEIKSRNDLTKLSPILLFAKGEYPQKFELLASENLEGLFKFCSFQNNMTLNDWFSGNLYNEIKSIIEHNKDEYLMIGLMQGATNTLKMLEEFIPTDINEQLEGILIHALTYGHIALCQYCIEKSPNLLQHILDNETFNLSCSSAHGNQDVIKLIKENISTDLFCKLIEEHNFIALNTALLANNTDYIKGLFSTENEPQLIYAASLSQCTPYIAPYMDELIDKLLAEKDRFDAEAQENDEFDIEEGQSDLYIAALKYLIRQNLSEDSEQSRQTKEKFKTLVSIPKIKERCYQNNDGTENRTLISLAREMANNEAHKILMKIDGVTNLELRIFQAQQTYRQREQQQRQPARRQRRVLNEELHTSETASWQSILSALESGELSLEDFYGKGADKRYYERTTNDASHSSDARNIAVNAANLLGPYVPRSKEATTATITSLIKAVNNIEAKDTRRKCKFAVDRLLRDNEMDISSDFSGRALLIGASNYLSTLGGNEGANDAEMNSFYRGLEDYIDSGAHPTAPHGDTSTALNFQQGVFKDDEDVRSDAGLDPACYGRLRNICSAILYIHNAIESGQRIQHTHVLPDEKVIDLQILKWTQDTTSLLKCLNKNLDKLPDELFNKLMTAFNEGYFDNHDLGRMVDWLKENHLTRDENSLQTSVHIIENLSDLKGAQETFSDVKRNEDYFNSIDECIELVDAIKNTPRQESTASVEQTPL